MNNILLIQLQAAWFDDGRITLWYNCLPRNDMAIMMWYIDLASNIMAMYEQAWCMHMSCDHTNVIYLSVNGHGNAIYYFQDMQYIVSINLDPNSFPWRSLIANMDALSIGDSHALIRNHVSFVVSAIFPARKSFLL